MEDSVIVIMEGVITLLLCMAYYYLFGRVKASKKVKILEILTLLATIIAFGLIKNAKIWVLFIAFYLIGMAKKILSKNERSRKRHYN